MISFYSLWLKRINFPFSSYLQVIYIDVGNLIHDFIIEAIYAMIYVEYRATLEPG